MQDALQRIRDRKKRRQAEKELADFMNRESMLREHEYTEPNDPYRSNLRTPHGGDHHMYKHYGRSADLDSTAILLISTLTWTMMMSADTMIPKLQKATP